MSKTYEVFADGLLEEARKLGYEVTVVRPKTLGSWLKESIPVFVWSLVVSGRAVKVCGVISHKFSQVSLEHRLPVFVRSVPSHFYNVAITTAGPIKIDLSILQFEVPSLAERILAKDEEAGEYDDYDPFGEERATVELVERAARNPFAAVRIEALPRHALSGMAIPYGESFDYEYGLRLVGKLRSGKGGHFPFGNVAFTQEDASVVKFFLENRR